MRLATIIYFLETTKEMMNMTRISATSSKKKGEQVKKIRKTTKYSD
jgi:uncharacterized membrane protein